MRESSLVNFNGQMQTNSTDYSEYTQQSGLMLPSKKSFDLGGQAVILEINDVEVNPQVEDADFN